MLAQQRPKTVPIVAAFLFAATGIAAVVGTSLIFPNRLLDRLWELNRPGAALFHAVGRIAGVATPATTEDIRRLTEYLTNEARRLTDDKET